jgi:excinuclease ABC subunit C
VGVYLFSNRHGNVLYVGKSKNVRGRVAQHVREGLSFGAADCPRTHWKRILMTATSSVECLPAATELHALLLEDDLIKRHRPPHNRRQHKFARQVYLELADGHGAPAARIAGRPRAGCTYGPFSDRFYAEKLLAILSERFGLAAGPGRALRNLRADARGADRFLMGHDDGLTEGLETQIRRLAAELQFERAAAVRDQLSFCRRFLRRQAFVRSFVGERLLVSERRSQRDCDHYLFAAGRLADHVRGAVPASWTRGGTAEPVEPDWLLFERALVVYGWLNSRPAGKSVRVLPRNGS